VIAENAVPGGPRVESVPPPRKRAKEKTGKNDLQGRVAMLSWIPALCIIFFPFLLGGRLWGL
jgi:hypothetical protein